jgi:hypothetical protein
MARTIGPRILDQVERRAFEVSGRPVPPARTGT